MAAIADGGVPLTEEHDWDVPGLGVRHLVWTNAYLTDDDGRRTHLVKTGVDVTDERAARSFVEAVLEAATATVIVGTDLEGVITLFNRGAENVLGYQARRARWVVATGRCCTTPSRSRPSARDLGIEPGFEVLVHRVRAGASTETRDWTYLRKDGIRRTASLTVSGIRDAGGHLTGYLGRRRGRDAPAPGRGRAPGRARP